MSEESIELSSLVGEHLLDAVDMSTESNELLWGRVEHSQVLRFRLDGKVYTAVEDPSDDYRSCMDRIFVSDSPMQNVFAPVKVLARIDPSEQKYQTNDTLELIDCANGKVILRVGTDNADDYYPWFVSEWSPENMACNEAAA